MRVKTIKVLKEYLHQPQRPRPRRAATELVGWAIVVFCCASSAYAASNSIIWERGDQIVQLAMQDDASAPPNDHPIVTTAGEIEAMLKMLRLRYADEESELAPKSVFTQEELDNLGDTIATGLGRAEPSQDVIFHVIGTRRLSPGAFAKRNRVSAGRVFYRGGNLNIIFGQVQTPHRKKNVYGQIDQDFYPRNYGSRTAVTKHDFILLPNSATRLYQDNRGTRNDWIVIEPGATAATAAAGQPDAEPEPSPSPASPAVPVVVAEASTTPSSPAAGNSVEKEKKQAGGTGAESAELTADVEERLEKLKRLHERELISEEAYQAKMKEILQDL